MDRWRVELGSKDKYLGIVEDNPENFSALASQRGALRSAK
jgi:hypothetical protein